MPPHHFLHSFSWLDYCPRYCDYCSYSPSRLNHNHKTTHKIKYPDSMHHFSCTVPTNLLHSNPIKVQGVDVIWWCNFMSEFGTINDTSSTLQIKPQCSVCKNSHWGCFLHSNNLPWQSSGIGKLAEVKSFCCYLIRFMWRRAVGQIGTSTGVQVNKHSLPV